MVGPCCGLGLKISPVGWAYPGSCSGGCISGAKRACRLAPDMRSKSLLLLTVVLSATALTGCVPDTASDLQSQTWRVVSTNGEAGQMNFNSSTVSYTSSTFSRGFSYEVEEGLITLDVADAEDDDPLVFEIERESGEYILVPENAEVREEFGELTLAPTEE